MRYIKDDDHGKILLKNLKKYSFLIGIALFFLIISKSNLSELSNILAKINLFYFSLAASLLFPLLLIKAYRWNYLKRKQNIIYTLKDSFLINNIALSVGFITPGRLGELSKIIYLKDKGYSIGKSLASVILDRLADLIFLLIIAIFGLIFLSSFFYKTSLLPILITLFLASLLILILKTNLIQTFLKKIFIFIIPAKYQKSWKVNFHDFIQNLSFYNSKNYLIVFLITLFSWIIYYSQAVLLAKSVGINNIPILYFITTITIAGFITLLPISISGLGTRDTTLIFFFSFFQIQPERTIAFSALILSMFLLTALIGLICFFSSTKKPVLLKL